MASLMASSPRAVLAKTTVGSRTSTRRPVVCSVSRDNSGETSRRAALAAFVGLPVAFVVAMNAKAIEITDGRRAYALMQSIDQARDSDEDERKRFSFQDVKGLTVDDHKKRAKESLARLSSDFQSAIDRKYWTQVQADLRHQLGTLRYDLDVLTANTLSDKSSKKQALALQDDVMRSLEQLDLAARNHNGSKALQSLVAATGKLDNLLSMLA